MSRLTHFLIMIVLLMALAAAVPSISAQQAPQQPATCPELVTSAFQVVDVVCDEATNNEACYGHARLDATPQAHVQRLVFDEAGDIANVADLQSLRLSPMDLEDSLWGVGLIRLRTYALNANARRDASILLFGDVTIENAVQSPTVTQRLTMHKSAGFVARVRQSPVYGLVIALLADGQVVTATGRLADSSWVRIELPDTGRTGWVDAALFDDPDAIAELAEVDPDSAQYGPMQAFAFASGQDDALCSEAPNSGLILQTPEGEAKVTFLINEVDIQLGSTVLLQAAPGDAMSVYLVEGSAEVTANGVTSELAPGMMVSVSLDENGMADAPPSAPEPYSPSDLQGFPGLYLDRAVMLDAVGVGAAVTQSQSADDDAGDDAGDDTGDDAGDDSGDDTGDGDDDTSSKRNDNPVTICHKGRTIVIDESALDSHLAHGDTIGACVNDK